MNRPGRHRGRPADDGPVDVGIDHALGLLADIDPGTYDRVLVRTGALHHLLDRLDPDETVRWVLLAAVQLPGASRPQRAFGVLAVADEHLLFLPDDAAELPVGRWPMAGLSAVDLVADAWLDLHLGADLVRFHVDHPGVAAATAEALSVARQERGHAAAVPPPLIPGVPAWTVTSPPPPAGSPPSAGSPPPPSESTPGADELRGPRVRLVPVRPEHGPRLRELHVAPGVIDWWQEPGPEWPFDADDDTTAYAVLLTDDPADPDGRLAGFVQWYAEDRGEFGRAGLDLFLDPALHGRGIGTEVVRVLCAHLIDVEGFHRLVIDPAAANAAAIACYSKVGFRPVGILREYGRDRFGRWYDGLLMDLLAAEFVRR